MILNSSGILWEATVVLILIIFDYSWFCKKEQNRKPNNAIKISIGFVVLSSIVWAMGLISNIDCISAYYGKGLFIAYLITSIVFLICLSFNIAVLAIVNGRNKKHGFRKYSI